MPAQMPPLRRQVHSAVGLAKLSAASGKGSLNRSKMTAVLPPKLAATVDQNVIENSPGIGFWQVAWKSAQADAGPVYAPVFQCISTIGVMPLATSRSTYALTAC